MLFNLQSIGAFPLRGTTRHGSARFAFPLQFSNAFVTELPDTEVSDVNSEFINRIW